MLTRLAAKRYFTQKRAAEHNLTGWVRNTDNNKVRKLAVPF